MKTSLRQRLADNLQLALIVIVAGLVFVFITPFTIYRIVSGHYLVAASNTVLIAISVGCAALALRTGETRVPGMVISTICMAGAVIVTLSRGIEGLFWFYPLIMFVFHLTRPRFALHLVASGLCVVTLAHVLGSRTVFPSMLLLFTFLATSICVCVFSHAFAKRNTRLRDKLQDLAARDGLTNLKNRRCLENELARAAAAKLDLGMEFGLIILDLDNLKDINDNFGHSRGDRALTDLAHLISAAIRHGDQAFRYGGDEFVILLSNVTAQGLEAVCKNLRRKIKAEIRCNGTPVTVSMGAALLDEKDTVQQWFQKADECLYQSKKHGRDRYNTYGALC